MIFENENSIEIVYWQQLYQQMQCGSHYFVQTFAGKLQLTKGLYLALQKKKGSNFCKTLAKSKPISHSNTKSTMKKSYDPSSKYRSRSKSNVSTKTIKMRSSMQARPRKFRIQKDNQIFKSSFLPNIPIIEMQCDNDCDSEWPQIEYNVSNLAMQLSMAVYDQRY